MSSSMAHPEFFFISCRRNNAQLEPITAVSRRQRHDARKGDWLGSRGRVF